MSFDDPVVITLVVALAIFLFGSAKIPELARNLGKAKKAFQNGFNDVLEEKESK